MKKESYPFDGVVHWQMIQWYGQFDMSEPYNIR